MIDYILFFTGIIVIVIALVVLKKNNNTQPTTEFQMVKNKEKELIESVYLVEKIIEELKIISEKTIQNIDVKTNDIYYMLQTLDKKMERYVSIINEKDINESNKYSKSMNQYVMNEENIVNNDQNMDTILRFVKEGYSPSQIAKKLNMGIGEVQLICNLKKR